MALYMGSEKVNMNVMDTYTQTGLVRCSELDMTLDDADSQNIVKLIQAINNGNGILVDGMYTIKGNAVEDITGDVILYGDTGECGFIYESTDGGISPMFTLTKDVRYIDLYRLSFIRDIEAGHGVLFWNESSGENDLNIEKMSVCNCYFENNFSLYRQEGDRLYNNNSSDGTYSTVKEFIFSKNRIKNMLATFCNLSDVCFESVEITHNRTENFLYTIFNLGTTNLPTEPTETQKARYAYLSANKKKVLADNNYIFCDDDCILTKESSYFCFLLAECQTVVYTNNHIEGMKASANAPTYDAYLSANSVLAEKNLWKNNVCFATNDITTKKYALMKAKQGGGVKTYRNNRYIITQEFLDMLVEKHGADPANFAVEMTSISDDSVWDVVRNVIDIASALCIFASNEPAKAFNFIGNDITARHITGYLTSCSEDGYALFEGNTIRTEDDTSIVQLYLGSFNRNLRIVNNTFIHPAGSIYSDIPAVGVIVENNRFISNTIGFLSLFRSVNNEFIANEAMYIEKEVTSDAFHRMKVDIKTSTRCRPISINLVYAPDSVTHLRLNKVNANGYTSGDIAINVYTGAAYTVNETQYDKYVTVTNLKDGSIVYDGAVRLEEYAIYDIPGGLLKLRIGDKDASVYHISTEPCTLSIERETVVA